MSSRALADARDKVKMPSEVRVPSDPTGVASAELRLEAGALIYFRFFATMPLMMSR